MRDFRMAWRNLWRNKRRTLITAASVFFAVFFALVMRSFQLGAYDRLFKNIIESYTGYLQVQHMDYFDDPVLDNGFESDGALMEKILNDPNVKTVVPRLESFALAAAGSRTQGVMVMGIDPEGEDEVSGIRNRMVKYRLTPAVISSLKNDKLPDPARRLLDIFSDESYSSEGRLMLDLGIEAGDSASVMPLLRRHASLRNGYIESDDLTGAVIGSGLSDYLKLGIGDTLVLMGLGYHGTTAAGKYEIRGIVKLPAPDIDNVIVYIPVEAARELYASPGMTTSSVISLKNNNEKELLLTKARLEKMISDPLVIRDWKELNALLINQMDADNKSGMIMIGILYLVIAFGVFGTVLMMLAERKREFGMLVSIGMQKVKLAKVISVEMLLIGFLGVAAGVIASLPVVFYGNLHPLRFTGEMARMYEDYGFEPVMPTLLPDKYYMWQTVVVLIIVLIAIAFSVRKVLKINVIQSLKA